MGYGAQLKRNKWMMMTIHVAKKNDDDKTNEMMKNDVKFFFILKTKDSKFQITFFRLSRINYSHDDDDDDEKR